MKGEDFMSNNNLVDRLKQIFAGMGVWCILLLNTRSNEAGLNSIKILLDIILAVMIVGQSILERRVAIGVAIASIILAWLNIPCFIEFILLAGFVTVGVLILKHSSEFPIEMNQKKNSFEYDDRTAKVLKSDWKERNRLNPFFEKYTYSPESGINIKKGVFKRTYDTVPTVKVLVRVNQTFGQRIIRVADVYFINSFNGKFYGDQTLHNIPIKSALELKEIINGPT
jgi:hypothetical protein